MFSIPMRENETGRLNSTEGTREKWLQRAAFHLMHLLTPCEPVEVRVSVGLPSVRATSTKNRAVGQCWPPAKTKDGVSQIFISPVLEESVEVLAVLLHELIHALTPGEGHTGKFKVMARQVGLEGKMTSTYPSPTLRARLQVIAQEIGEYPHARLLVEGREKQTTRMHKVMCRGCGYTVRVSRQWIEHSLPYHMECERFFERVEEA